LIKLVKDKRYKHQYPLIGQLVLPTPLPELTVPPVALTVVPALYAFVVVALYVVVVVVVGP
jgi:hypothetical protein